MKRAVLVILGSFVLPDAAADVAQTWSIDKGLLRCQGQPAGYMRTETPYADYHLQGRLSRRDRQRRFPGCGDAVLRAGRQDLPPERRRRD